MMSTPRSTGAVQPQLPDTLAVSMTTPVAAFSAKSRPPRMVPLTNLGSQGGQEASSTAFTFKFGAALPALLVDVHAIGDHSRTQHWQRQ